MPASQTKNLGESVNFTVTAFGPYLKYQWRKDGVNIPGATSATYSLAQTQTNHAGNFDVVISNNWGSVTSTPPAVLTLLPALPPIITAFSHNQFRNLGASLNLGVSVNGYFLSYQWRKDGADIPGATNGIYSIRVATTNDAGSYSVVVRNPAGSVTSAPPAVLTLYDTSGGVVTWGRNYFGQTDVPAAAQSGRRCCGGLLSHSGLEDQWVGGGLGRQPLWSNGGAIRSAKRSDRHRGERSPHSGIEERRFGGGLGGIQ